MKYIRKFNTKGDYNSYIGTTTDYPNVCLVADDSKVVYNLRPEPLYVEALEYLTVSFSNTYEFSRDNSTWEEATSKTVISANGGEKVYFRASGLTPNYISGIGKFTISNGYCNVGGNIMSMVSGDNFINDTNIKDYQFYYLFKGCSTIINAGGLNLPATTLATNCYREMFSGCTGLTTTPQLPATTLADGCYSYMFSGCTSLTTAPDLPATMLAHGCYFNMFLSCTSLTTAPDLPATTLAESCYASMFMNCTNLTSSPSLPATTLVSYCYDKMFYGTNCLPDCSNIDFANSVGLIGLFAGTKVTDEDLFNILPINEKTGRYYLPETLPFLLTYGHYRDMFLGCTSLTTAPELPTTYLKGQCYYSMFKNCTSLTVAPELPSCSLSEGCYSCMFENCTNLTTSPELPSTILASECYYSMFKGCTSLTTTPSLNATTLARGCYREMFSGCTSLTTAPDLPATMLTNNCYKGMFENCTNLTVSPALPATTLAESCYYEMFKGCTNLSASPSLLATTLVQDCYSAMFYGTNCLPDCSNIDFTNSVGLQGLFAGTKVTDEDLFDILPINEETGRYCLPDDTLAKACYSGMFKNCVNLTTAPELPATVLTYRCYSNMFEGCESLTTAPDLPATILEDWSYEKMFYGCSKINYIKAMFTNQGSGRTTKWVYGVAKAGTFVKNSAATWNNIGVDGVPSGWTIEYTNA